MTFGEEICDILSDLDMDWSRSLVGWYFFEGDAHFPIAEVKYADRGWSFWCDGSPDVETFTTVEEAQNACREWAKNTARVIQGNMENEVWDSTP